MRVIGITGGIGSGKSTVCKMFELLRVPVYHADDQARELCNTHPDIIREVVALIGEQAYVDGIYNRAYIGSIVFQQPHLLEKLNGIIHPRVAHDFDEWCGQWSHVPFVIKEAAILFESGADKQVDRVITVTAPVDMRTNRVMKRDGLSSQQVTARMNNQWSDEEKMKRSHFVIFCNEKQLVIPQVLHIYQQLQ